MERIIYTRACKYCGDEFETEKRNQVYDTDGCRIAYNNRKGYKQVKHRVYKLDLYKKALIGFIQEITNGHGYSSEKKQKLANEYSKQFNQIYDALESKQK